MLSISCRVTSSTRTPPVARIGDQFGDRACWRWVVGVPVGLPVAAVPGNVGLRLDAAAIVQVAHLHHRIRRWHPAGLPHPRQRSHNRHGCQHREGNRNLRRMRAVPSSPKSRALPVPPPSRTRETSNETTQPDNATQRKRGKRKENRKSPPGKTANLKPLSPPAPPQTLCPPPPLTSNDRSQPPPPTAQTKTTQHRKKTPNS